MAIATEPPLRLEARRREAIADFIASRSAEGNARYRAVFAARMHDAATLFSVTNDLLDFASCQALANDPGLIEVARYLAAPPISGGDLNTLAEANVATRKKLDADLGQKTALIILAALDPERFPWLFSDPRRAPTHEERRLATSWTVGLKAAANLRWAQDGGIAIFWQRDLTPLAEFVQAAR